MKPKQDNYLLKGKRSNTRKNVITIGLLAVGAVILCSFLAIMQNVSSERNQATSSRRILSEVENTLRDNDEISTSIKNEFNEINQTNINTLSQYITYAELLNPIRNAASMTQEEIATEVGNITTNLGEIKGGLGINDILIVSNAGDVVLGSNASYIGQSMSATLTEEQTTALFTHTVDADGNDIQSGTSVHENGVYHSRPVILDYSGMQMYLYSTYFDTSNSTDYYVLTYVRGEIIEDELSGLKSIESVLSGITVGKTGFLFSVDSNDGTFKYFNDGNGNKLTGEKFSDYGVTTDIVRDDYAGYQKIEGVSYYCVSKTFSSETYGEFTVIAAAVSKDEIVTKNVLTIFISCLAFVLVSCIVAGYGLILRRDICDHILNLEDKYKADLRDDNTSGNTVKLTEEEIYERTRILIQEDIENNKEKKLKRKNIGVRNAKGTQSYFSLYIFSRMISVIIIGLIAIFGISFFSQTLLGLNDATSVSTERLNEIVETIEKNENNSETIQTYVDDQFLSKARLVSYLLEETPEILFLDANEHTTHRVYDKDENGVVTYLNYEEYPGVQRYAYSKAKPLQEFCDNNNIRSIFVLSDDGRTIATNTDLWYFSLSKNPEDQSYPFNDILEDKVDFYVQDARVGDATGTTDKYIGTEFFYYTYLDSGVVKFATKNDYKSFVDGTWPKGDITKHRSLIQIGVDESAVAHLFGTTSISYILDNMHVYGEDSFFIAFEKGDEHKVVYSPYDAMIGKTALNLGISESAFTINGTYNGFQKVNGVEYYQSFQLVGDYYVATAIPTASIYETRNGISSYTLLFSGIFIIVASALFTVSSDRADKDYCNAIKYKGRETEDNVFILTTPSGKKRRTRSVASRFTRIVWRKKTPEEKLSAILMMYLSVASIALIGIIIYALNNRASDSIFSYIFSGVWERGFNVFAITESIMIMIIIIAVTMIAQICVRSFCGTLGARVETTGNLVVSVLKYGGVLGGLFYCLYLFGLNTASLLTSAGILSIVIGLGAQSLISDIIAGIFIVFEGAFRVGDIVTIGDFRGQVLEIGLRTTKIEDISKNIKIFNNSAISGVLNMTKEASFASVDVGIEYGESLERVEKVLKDEFPRIRRRIPEIIDGPYYKGVQELGNNSVNIKILAQCEEKDRIQLSRDLNREIFLLFNKHNINIPFPQVTLSYLRKNEEKAEVSIKEKSEADDFVKEQKEASADKETSEGI
ncbi:MAG: mechanosensitive ion channel family protein [Bacilli bacterium]|nr:mechanosensitive ion channel family protein [Bacilli bacterium]